MKYDDEHQIGDYVDLILNFMPDGETPDNYLTAGKVIKKHYDTEESPPYAYDLEFTTEIRHDKNANPNRITTRVFNVGEAFCWMRETHNNMDSAGVAIAKAKKSSPQVDLFEAFSIGRTFRLNSTEYRIKMDAEQDQYVWHVFDDDAGHENEKVFKYTIMKKSFEGVPYQERLPYLLTCFEDMIDMLKSDIERGLVIVR
jgi:hypothetical protein